MADSIMKTLNGYEVCDAVARGMSPVVATSEDGVSYTAEVNGITEITNGLSFIIVPNMTSTSTCPTLSVNGLESKQIRQKLSTNSVAAVDGCIDNWLIEGTPIRVTYNDKAVGVGAWVTDFTKPDAHYLNGTVPIENGGTNADTVGQARINLGIGGVNADGTGALSVENGGTGYTNLEDFKVALESVSSSGVVAIENGGTGATNAEQARENLGITPTNIGASASDHTHNYAGSDTPGGVANSAIEVNTADGKGKISSSSGNDNSLVLYHPDVITTSGGKFKIHGNWPFKIEIVTLNNSTIAAGGYKIEDYALPHIDGYLPYAVIGHFLYNVSFGLVLTRCYVVINEYSLKTNIYNTSNSSRTMTGESLVRVLYVADGMLTDNYVL